MDGNKSLNAYVRLLAFETSSSWRQPSEDFFTKGRKMTWHIIAGGWLVVGCNLRHSNQWSIYNGMQSTAWSQHIIGIGDVASVKTPASGPHLECSPLNDYLASQSYSYTKNYWHFPSDLIRLPEKETMFFFAPGRIPRSFFLSIFLLTWPFLTIQYTIIAK